MRDVRLTSSDGRTIVVFIDKLAYIDTYLGQTVLHFTGAGSLVVEESISEVEQMLEAVRFCERADA